MDQKASCCTCDLTGCLHDAVGHMIIMNDACDVRARHLRFCLTPVGEKRRFATTRVGASRDQCVIAIGVYRYQCMCDTFWFGLRGSNANP